MDKTNNLTIFLTDVANAIRTAKGSVDQINPQQFSNEISRLRSVEVTLSMTSNSTQNASVLAKVNAKRSTITDSVANTTIDGDVVYKIEVQNPTSGSDVLDTVFYTREGDAAATPYCYYLSGIDNYLGKENQ